MQEPFRPLSGNEAEILRKLLEPEFPGRDELLQQLTYVSARQILDDGTLELHCEGAPKAQVTRRVPTEGEYLDADGHTVNVLLHVKNGLMCELEILKNYPTKILKPPQARDLVVMARTSEA